MTSTIKVNTITTESGSTLTVGGCGKTVALASGASQTGFGRTGTVDWDTTPKTTTFTAVSGDGFFCNTTSGAFTCNLPAGSPGAIVSLADYAGTWQTNNLTVSPNGSEKIGGIAGDAVLSTEGQSVTFVYVDGTQGWLNIQDSTSNERGSSFICASVSGSCNTLTTVDTNFKVATFVGPGTFTINSGAGSKAQVDYLVVGGGAGGAGHNSAGGGGAGGFRESHCASVSGPYSQSPLASSTPLGVLAPGAYPITVGAGGSAGSSSSGSGGSGGTSTFSTITSAGGGGGGGQDANGIDGGSGGGGGGGGGPGNSAGGSGNTPPVSPPQGNDGGANVRQSTPAEGGGGGGAGAVGGPGGGPTPAPNRPSQSGGTGGTGVTTNINGSTVTRSGGGGGAGYAGTPSGGSGGGGAGGGGPTASGVAGTANTGGGGGGSRNATGATGGSGIVIIRYKFQ